ncbi:large ribosomal subunit protein mL44 [Topomyia yanbarensis]|uniref:large ribosomal subunit protein mL44 n=1 Tax=Topomyia yanbarensis TaxID=2498891 RepID=UPI00273A7557|nr:large ribosomal subunit protein mL44 [Topomyia yanbarensis]
MSYLVVSTVLARNISRSLHYVQQTRHVHRWVGPTLRELKRRREKMGPEAVLPRSTHSDWNYNAEIFAFGKRLSEQFDTKLLQQAFTHQSFIAMEEQKQVEVGIDQPQLGLQDNRQLMEHGQNLIQRYVQAFLLTALPKLPEEGIQAIAGYLTTENQLAYVSKHLGTTDIILSAEFPVTEKLLADTLKAVVGVLHKSSGEERAYLFIRDFICTQLNQQDVNEHWNIEDPLALLQEYCRKKKLGEPEPRSIGLVGKNTLLAAHNVAIYCNKQFVGSGYGEDVDTAIREAAWDSLRQLFGTEHNMKPINFSLELKDVVKNVKQEQRKKQ